MAIVLEKDARKYVLKPMEAMIHLVDSVAVDPINYKNIENLKNKVKSSMGKMKINRGSNSYNSSQNNNIEIEGAEYEMKIIQLAIIKISALLAIGFGEAGGEILKENISSQEGLNPMLPGKKKSAIIIFRDITEEKSSQEYQLEFSKVASHQLRSPIANVKWI
jgi:hypothetical protein